MAFLISLVGDLRGGGLGRPFFLPKPLDEDSSSPFLADSVVVEEVGEEVMDVELICGVPTC